MEIFLQITHAANNSVRRWRHISCIAWSCSANPILSTPELPRCLCSSARPGHQDLMYFFDQPHRHWETVHEPLETMVHRSNIVRHFLDVIQRNTRCLLAFIEE